MLAFIFYGKTAIVSFFDGAGVPVIFIQTFKIVAASCCPLLSCFTNPVRQIVPPSFE